MMTQTRLAPWAPGRPAAQVRAALPAGLALVLALAGGPARAADTAPSTSAPSTPVSSTPKPAAAVPADAVPAGLVKRLAGAVTLVRSGQRLPAAVGMAVQVGDQILTGPDAAVGITLSDDTLLTLGAHSELVLSRYDFDATSHDGGLLASLWRGTLSVVTGLLGKKSPEAVKVQTRTVVLGARGTEFIVDSTGAQR